MSTDFTSAGEFHHGKGTKKSRLGPRITIRGGAKLSPNEIAVGKLKAILLKRNVLNQDLYEYIAVLRNSDQIRFMNMNVLAEVIIYMGKGEEIGDLTYSSISDHIEVLMMKEKEEKQTDEDMKIVRLRMAATFLRYLKYIAIAQRRANEKEEE